MGGIILGNTFLVKLDMLSIFAVETSGRSPSKRIEMLATRKSDLCNVVLECRDWDFLVVEMKCPSLFRIDVDVECLDIIDAYNEGASFT